MGLQKNKKRKETGETKETKEKTLISCGIGSLVSLVSLVSLQGVHCPPIFVFSLDSLPAPRQHLGIHAVIALAVFIGVTALSNGPLKATILEWQTEGRVSIAVEHDASAALALDISTLQGSAIIDCINEGGATLLLSLPDSWERREVRRARLEDTAPTETGLGYIRWTLPPGATLSMNVPETPAHLTLHHPSTALLKVRLSRVDLSDNTVERDTILVQGNVAEIW